MALKDLVTDLGSFYENNPFAAEFKSKAGPTYAQKYGFNQRSLEYGEDRPGDGSSRQPFIKGGIPGVEENLPSATGLIAGITREAGRREDDLKRITTFLTTTKGLLFIAKQQVLSSQNPIVPGKPNRYKPSKGFYNPLATLANVAASGTGVHLNKQGKILKSFDDSLKYEKVYKESSQEDFNDIKLGGNRLALLQNLTATGTALSKSNATSGVSYNVGSDIISYNGGPGILTTNIRYADNSVYQGSAITNKGDSTYTLKQLNEQKSVWSPDGPKNLGLITGDFRGNIPYETENASIGVFEKNVVDYSSITVNKIQRVGLGDPGRRARDRSNLYISDPQSIDKVSNFPLYKNSSVASEVGDTRDFIRFRFEVLDNDSDESTFIHFRAFLGGITDNYNAAWDPTKYVGRGDTFYNYAGFTRTINLSFKVHPQTRDEMAAMYQKLTYLASTLAPDYSKSGGYMRGNIVRLVVGSYLYRIPGFITSLTYSVPEDASWEIAYNEPESGTEKSQLEAPRHFDVQVNFTPIHDFAPQLMDGTRKYALFTPDQVNFGRPNPYLPKEGTTSIIATSSTAAESLDAIKRIAANTAAKAKAAADKKTQKKAEAE
jgi:hypothetical protein